MKKVMFGLCEWSSPVQGPYVCRFAKDMGLDGVELAQGDYERSFPLSNPYIQDIYLEEAARNGIALTAIAVNCLDYYGMTKPDGSMQKKAAVLAIEKAVEAAKRMRLPLVQIPAFGESAIHSEEDFRSVAACLAYACRLAAEDGITVASENALSVEEDLRLLEEVACPNLKIYMDTQNPYINKGYSAPEMIYALGDKICEVHVKDGKEGELSAALLGQGVTSFYESVEALCDIGYTGYVHLENFYERQPMNHCDKDAVELLRKDIAILKESFREYNGDT
ncbi:sugar phosphate isomerase/epimerase family protein [Dorea sp. D27]|uniref:sugar phosphate isomerase/epimerase family protein n=1 Tax=Dorea sp. D27 TaxID=658665 RepID=UPI0006736C3A|nr:sugar phosphate isomerase/epimerase family protein [Dorea sp. D27]KMZ53315.1 AP endonuclease, family 2 [Dorea sp. D27]